MTERGRILIVDDDPSFREVLAATLASEGLACVAAASGAEALAAVEKDDGLALVMTDVRMPGLDGYELVRRVKYLRPTLPVIVLTAFGSIKGAVEAMRLGADNYIAKPFDGKELRGIVRETLSSRAGGAGRAARAAGEYVFESPAMKRVVEAARRAARVEATVLITGETGTGKEAVAEVIHAGSGREKLVRVNCAAIPRDLLESELFGHRKGAFTGAGEDRPGRFVEAHRGTLLLDEVGEMEGAVQAKLLRVLETKTVDVLGGGPVAVDVKVIAATNADPEGLVREGRLRRDLYYRLNVIRIDVPPLRERGEDIRPLMRFFLRALSGGKEPQVAPRVFEAFERYDWPGNVRELRSLCQRLLLMSEGSAIGERDLPPFMRSRSPGVAVQAGTGGPEGERGGTLMEIEREIIVKALEKSDWNQSQAARSLGIARHVLLYRMEKFGITPPERKKGKEPEQ